MPADTPAPAPLPDGRAPGAGATGVALPGLPLAAAAGGRAAQWNPPVTSPPLPSERLDAHFAEIAPPLTPDAALLEANKCLYCYDAPCTLACPTHIDVASFIKKIATGNLRGSARVILDANPMGHSCARACPVEVLCEGACVLNERDEQPIAIALLQRHATDHALRHDLRLFEPGAPTGKRVAIVGAGPAGLSCAQDLRRMGHAVTIFEEREVPGGLNTFAIAEYKMRVPLALAEAKMALDLGAELRPGVRVGRDVGFEQLERDHDAVFIGVGLGDTRRLDIPGEELPGVADALAFIEHLKTRPYSETSIGRHVVVVGAGNTAIDAATQAKRLGAERVTIVYRRGEEEMPAYDYEYEIAKRDGCEFRFNTLPRRVLGDGRATGLECVRTEAAVDDGKSATRNAVNSVTEARRAFREVPGSEHVIECDIILRALGQMPHSELARQAGLELVGSRMVSVKPNVFVGGDCGSGGAEIVNAAADGVIAADRIDRYLGGPGRGAFAIPGNGHR